MKQNQSRSFLLIGSVTVLLFFAFVIVNIIKKDSHKEEVFSSSVQKHQKSPAQYSDSATGFTLTVPVSWQEIGYKISTTSDANKTITYSATLAFTDESGMHYGFGTSEIVAVPTGVDSSQYKMSGPDNSLEVGTEIGKNSRYTFISRQLSPEAFGQCTSDKNFSTQNERLCKEGSSLRNPERVAGAFSVAQ